MKKFELLAASALAITVATPAWAQDTAGSPGTTTPAQTPAPETADKQPTQTPTQAANVQDDAGLGANDIIVTATRRNETVQNVPVAITAVPAELLRDANVTDVRGLEQLAPSLQTTTGQSAATGASLSIRGVGTAGDNPGFEPAVGVFIDGVFRSRAGIALSELPELERAEVLRGPQGTLFGRNTSAGALSIFTAKPQFKTTGFVEGSYGNYNAYEVKGGLTGPVTDTIALRADGGYRNRDGFIHDANTNRRINDVDRWYARGQLLFDNGGTTFRLIGDYSQTNENCCGALSVVRGPLTPIIQGIAASRGLIGLYTGQNQNEMFTVNGAPVTYNVSTDLNPRIQAYSPNRDYSERVRDWGISGELNFSLGDVNVTGISAYRNWRVLRDQDVDFSGIDRAYRQGYRSGIKDFTQEVRVQGTAFGKVLDYLVGGFYLNENLTLRDTVRIGVDGNAYVDSIFNALAGPSFGGRVQFFGSLGPTVPTPGAVLLNPAVPNALPALQAVYGATLAPLVGCFRAQAGTAPSSLCVIPGFPSAPIPGLAALAASPLPAAAAGQGNNNDDFRVKTNAFALFTHNIIHVTDKLSLTLGARYNHEDKKLDASINNNLGSCGFFDQVRAGNPAANAYANLLRTLGLFNNLFLLSCNPAVNNEFNGSYNNKRTENRVTGTAKLSYAFTPRYLAYFSYDRGYKSGGYNLDQATFDSVLLGGNGPQGSDLGFGPETVDNYEVGIKTSPSPQFTLNIAAFYAKYRDLQSLVFSGNNFVVQNISRSTSRGVEAEAVLRPTTDWTVRLGYTYNEVFIENGVTFPAGSPLNGAQGQQFGNQPRNVVTASSTWNPRLTGNIRGIFHVDARYNSQVNIFGAQPSGRDIVNNPGYPLIAASLGAQTQNGKLRGEVFVENLTNQYYNVTGFAVPEQTGNYAGYPGEPRTYGIRLRAGF